MTNPPRNSTAPVNPRERETTLQELWATLWRSRWTVLGITGGIVALVAIGSILAEPVYESEAVLRIETEDSQSRLLSTLGPLSDIGGLGGLSGLGESEIDTEMGILRSRRLATEVADSLGLTVEVLDPKVRGASVLRVVGAARDTLNGTFLLRRTGNGDYRLSTSWRTFRRPALPSRVSAGEPFRVGATTLVLEPAPGAPQPEVIRFRIRSHQRMLAEVEKSLKVNTLTSGSQLVQVSYRDSDPRLAAAVVNQLVTAYVAYKLETDKSKSTHRIDVLRTQTALYGGQLRDAEDRLRDFQAAEQIIAPEEQATQQVRRIAEVQAARDMLDIERGALQALLAEVERRPSEPGMVSPYRQLATFPSFISNGGIQDLLQALIDLENERAELLGRRTEQNVDVRTIDARIADLEGQLYRLAGNYLESLETQIASANLALARFGREVEAVPAREVEYARLARQRKLLTEIYATMQARLEEAQVQEAIDEQEVRVIDYGLVPEEPVFPKPLVNVVLGTFLGLMVGLMVVVGRDMVSTRIRSRADAEHATEGLPVLAVIPAARLPATNGNGASGKRLMNLPWLRAGQPSSHSAPGLVTTRDPWHPASSAYRSILATLSFGAKGGPPSVIAFTSSAEDDGASQVAANFAVTLAQQGARTILVDASGSAVSHDHLFAGQAQPSTSDGSGGDSLRRDGVREVHLEFGGAPLHVMNGSGGRTLDRLPAAGEMRQLLEELRSDYEYVVIHAPPLSVTAEAVALGRLADTMVLVARTGATSSKDLQTATTDLRRAGVAIGGIVLNDSADSRWSVSHPRPRTASRST